MSEYHIVLSPRARADLSEIYAYSCQSWGVPQADRYLGHLEAAFHRLRENPDCGRVRADIQEGYRSLSVEKHQVFYMVCGHEIHILGVLHARMDILNHYFG